VTEELKPSTVLFWYKQGVGNTNKENSIEASFSKDRQTVKLCSNFLQFLMGWVSITDRPE